MSVNSSGQKLTARYCFMNLSRYYNFNSIARRGDSNDGSIRRTPSYTYSTFYACLFSQTFRKYVFVDYR